MVFGGTEEPTAFGELTSIGAIGGEKNKQISKLVSDIVTSKFGVPSDRFYLVVRPLSRSSCMRHLLHSCNESAQDHTDINLCGATVP